MEVNVFNAVELLVVPLVAVIMFALNVIMDMSLIQFLTNAQFVHTPARHVFLLLPKITVEIVQLAISHSQALQIQMEIAILAPFLTVLHVHLLPYLLVLHVQQDIKLIITTVLQPSDNVYQCVQIQLVLHVLLTPQVHVLSARLGTL